MLGEDITEFVENNLGIKERRVLADDESAADIASRAAENALKNAGISAEEIDLIIVATDTPEYLSPELRSSFSIASARKTPELLTRTPRVRDLLRHLTRRVNTSSPTRIIKIFWSSVFTQ